MINRPDEQTRVSGIIYLYQPFSARLLEMIHKPYIWFSDPSKFNDPFELPVVIVDEWSDEEMLEEVSRIYSLEGSNDGEVLRSRFSSALQALTFLRTKEPKLLKALLRKNIAGLEKAFTGSGVACFSSVVTEVLMWSHYADKHAGVAVGYDLATLLKNHPAGDVLAFDVSYEGVAEKMRAGQIVGDIATNVYVTEYLRRKLHTKHPSWSYEEECRLLNVNGKGALTIPPDSIREIYLGCRMSEPVKKAITDTLRLTDISIFEMKKVDPFLLQSVQVGGLTPS